MRLTRSAVMLAALLAILCGTALAGGVVPGFTTKNATLLESRGLPMSEQDATERITFRPFVPSPNYVEVALLPAQHGDDKDVPQNRGIGFEYVSGGRSYVLSEWPDFPGSLAAYPTAALNGTCTTGRLILGTPLHPRAFGWTTAVLVFALQPDVDPGVNPDLKALKAEWSRLVKRGACR